jgi:hypothetical protein
MLASILVVKRLFELKKKTRKKNVKSDIEVIDWKMRHKISSGQETNAAISLTIGIFVNCVTNTKLVVA